MSSPILPQLHARVRAALSISALLLTALAGCADIPFLQTAAPTVDYKTLLLQAQSRETQFKEENARLQAEVDRQAREIGSLNASLKTLQAQVDAATEQATIDSAAQQPQPAATAPAAQQLQPSAPAASTPRSGGSTVYTGPRGGRYTITPSGNKRYLPRR